MNTLTEITFNINISPSEINTVNFKKHLCTKYNNNIHNGIYINEILKIIKLNYGKILSNGYINVNIEATCDIIDLKIEHVYANIIITNYNKLGSFVNLNKVSIFIPKEFSIDEQTLETGSSIDLKIVGKRIDDKIMCIGQQV